MDDDEISGDTFGVVFDVENSTVTIANDIFTKDSREFYIFRLAYKMGRDHKKIQIRRALGI